VDQLDLMDLKVCVSALNDIMDRSEYISGLFFIIFVIFIEITLNINLSSYIAIVV